VVEDSALQESFTEFCMHQ